MKRIILVSCLVIALALSACGGAPVQSNSSKPVNIRLETDPNPARLGNATVTLNITDVNDTPIEGATVDVSAEHTSMAMGSISGVATDQGGGKYTITTGFSMSGTWKFTVHVRKDGLDYQEDIEIPVQ